MLKNSYTLYNRNENSLSFHLSRSYLLCMLNCTCPIIVDEINTKVIRLKVNKGRLTNIKVRSSNVALDFLMHMISIDMHPFQFWLVIYKMQSMYLQMNLNWYVCPSFSTTHNIYLFYSLSRYVASSLDFSLRTDPSHSVFGYISFKFEILR